MSWRDAAWLQRGLNVLKATFDGGDTLKSQMIDFLREEGFWDKSKQTESAARAKFNACMNPGRPDFFKISEVLVLMKRFHRYELFYWMCDELGFERPRKMPTAERTAELLDRMAEADARHQAEQAAMRHELAMLSDEIDAVPVAMGEAGLRVHPALRELGPAFSLDDGAETGGF